MTTIHEIASKGHPAGARYAIVASRFNNSIVSHLVNDAIETLKKNGVAEKDITLVYVPGAFELPLTAKKLIANGNYDAIIALGAVIRGETPHFEYVASGCTQGLSQVSLDSGVPVAFGVLTVDTPKQAEARAVHGRKGADVALTAIGMVSVLQQLEAK
ncbi:MAG: 6,7-dimethyl-8-ribityllumazine synthase [Pseudohongiellaceae bacterium]